MNEKIIALVSFLEDYPKVAKRARNCNFHFWIEKLKNESKLTSHQWNNLAMVIQTAAELNGLSYRHLLKICLEKAGTR